ncbi:MAG: alkaline phosphatase family protein [bacterium]
MRLITRLKAFAEDRRLYVLSLDGVPYSFLQEEFKKGNLPYLNKLFREGSFRQMNSTLPPISSVAWSTYMTGKNPAAHNIFGFIDRVPSTLKLYIPMAKDMKAKTIWDFLSARRKKIIVINLPVTSPPRQVNGILIGGFLAPTLEKAVYPSSLIPKLKELGYKIDIDAQQARKDRNKFIDDLYYSTNRRLETATYLMNTQPWDFFHLHIMGTDRIGHFLWKRWEENDPYFAPKFNHYFKTLDEYIGTILIPSIDNHDNSALLFLSDHGFCKLRKEVYINTFLQNIGWLRFKSDTTQNLYEMHPESKAYSLIPGRIYLNVKNREIHGCIDKGRDYERICRELADILIDMKDPLSGERMIKQIYKGSDIYQGPFAHLAPDLVLIPVNGYELKGEINTPSWIMESELDGMHTYNDAFVFIRDHKIVKEECSIIDVTPTIFNLMNIDIDAVFDGQCLI